MINIGGLSKISQTVPVSYFSRSISQQFKLEEKIALTSEITVCFFLESLAWYMYSRPGAGA
jgi:hypothetical protein